MTRRRDGLRRSGVAESSFQWDVLDLERSRARLRDTKTGLSWRELGGAALAVVRALPRIEDSPYVFPSRDATKPLTEINHVWYAVRHAASLHDLRLHDIRHHFASTGAERQLSLLTLGALLGHRDMSTTRKYAHLSDDPVRRAADEISASIAASVSGDSKMPIALHR